MVDAPVNQFIGRFFYQQSLRVRVILTQIPFFLTVALATILISILDPAILGNPQLALGLLLTAALTLACFVVPWEKLHPASFLVIPYLDFVAVALVREGSQTLLSTAGILSLFPVFWLCASGFAPKTAVLSSTLASLLIVWNPVFQSGQVTVEALIRPLLFPFMMLAFAIAVVTYTTSMDKHRIALQAKDNQLREALAKSQHRERLLETVVNTVGVGVVAVDAEGNDLLMNSTQLAMHAIGRPEGNPDPEEKELLLFDHDKVPLPTNARPVRRAINGERFTNYQIWVGAGSDARALSVTARHIPHENGSQAGAVIAFLDVTEMVNALAAKDDFVANVSHEFRTPLTAIQSYLELVLEDTLLPPEDVSRYLHIAARNAQRLERLVSDLLTTTSITADCAPVNVARLLADCLASAAPAAAANAVKTVWQCQDPLMVMVDGVRIAQVLDNLVSNAVKYSPDGGTLTLSAWADGLDLRCTVTDTGLGMNAAEQAGAFQKFFRARTAVGRGIPGIGLGLMISKTIIETHGGSLTMDSRYGSGTTMSFVIPDCVIVKNPDKTALSMQGQFTNGEP